MYKKACCTCRVAILLIKPLLFWRSCCSRRRSFVRSLLSDLSERRSFKTFCLWQTSYSIAWENRSVHGLGEWYAKSSSFYRKTVAKAWNWYQRWVSTNGTRITAWNIPSGKTGLLSQMAVVPVNFPLQLKRRVALTFQPDFLVNNLNFFGFVDPILTLSCKNHKPSREAKWPDRAVAGTPGWVHL